MIAHAGAADESLAVAMLVAAAWIVWIAWQRLKGAGLPRLPKAGAYALIGVAVLLAVGATVVPRAIFPTVVVPSGGPTGQRIASSATLSFVEPSDGTRVAGDQLEVVLDLEDGTVVQGTSSSLAPGEGHIHLSVDGQLVSMTYGEIQVIDMRPWGPGPHTIEAEFVAADHLAFDPPVVTTVEVTEA
jgi:hypothetical protein